MHFCLNDRGKNILPMTAILFIALFSCTMMYGCVSGTEHQKLKTQYAALEKQNKELADRVKTLEEDNTKFKEKTDLQIEEIGALKRRLTDAGIAETTEEQSFETCKENLKKIAQALKLYAADNGGSYPKKMEKISPNPKYLEFIPTCPSMMKDTYSDGYEVSKDKKAFTVYCQGEGHLNILVKENYPQYSSASGVLVEKETKKPSEDEEDEEEPAPSPSPGKGK